MTRTRYLPILLAAICIALGSSLVGVAAPPNVVMILSDDQAWNDYGFMGHETIETPHLDRLASESLTFRRGYVPTSLCRPSLATIITGLYPHQHGVVGNDPPRPVIEGQPKRRIPSFDPRYVPIRRQFLKHVDAMTTLPDLLSPLGYRSMQTGKWWEGKYDRGGFTDGMTIGNRAKGGRHGDAGLVIGRKGFSVVDEFLDSARKENTPFFLWYAPFLPHTPHTPPKRLLDKYSKRTDSLPMAKYYAMVEWFDETCGDLMKRIDERGMRDNTIVIYVTDNGWINRKDSSRYAPRSKRSPNEGGLRTPI
ncbi:MAG: sulfatase-like hydrolase/transferase, partial [Planctomycetota bacterium]